jgi:ATP-dependent RNA helicase DHX37/DHR1
VLPAIKPKAGARKGDTQDKSAGEAPARPLSKSELRKLKQVQMKKERRENLGQVLATLQSSSISEDKLALMRPLHQRGAKETKKQRLRRALRLERAGLVPDAEAAAELYRPRVVRVHGDEGDEDEAEEGSDEEVGFDWAEISKCQGVHTSAAFERPALQSGPL